MANTFKKLTALLIIATSITGCGSGQTAATRNIKQVTDGVEGQSNEIKLRNVLIVKTADSQGVLVATLVHTSDDSDSIVGIGIGAAAATYTAKSSELIKNKPIICTKIGYPGHIELLKDQAIWYTENNLENILMNFNKNENSKKDWNAYKEYTPEKVIQQFKKVFIDND